jgi:hypothetical protein
VSETPEERRRPMSLNPPSRGHRIRVMRFYFWMTVVLLAAVPVLLAACGKSKY